jgi:hypothetical protein
VSNNWVQRGADEDDSISKLLAMEKWAGIIVTGTLKKYVVEM